MSELLSCPFCGCEADLSKSSGRDWIVGCSNGKCIMCPWSFGFSTEQEAIEAWNTRAERTITPVLDDHDWPVWRCPDCGQPINRADNYCSSCGVKVTPTPL